LLGVYKTNMRVSKLMEAYVIKEYPQYVERLAQLYPQAYPAFANGHTFTTAHNRQLMGQLMQSVKNGESILVDKDYLLARDFLALEQPQQFDDWKTTGQDCMLVWLPSTHVAIIDEIKQSKGLLVGELDGSFLVSEMDEVDEIIINELAAPKSYLQLLEDLKGYLDEEAMEEWDTFRTMVTNRLRYFITAKALLFYMP
jgi:choline dehydrogenase-like flavoprotein